MTFFYDLNKRLAALAAKQDTKQITESAEVAESKFSKLAKEIGKNPKVKNPEAVAASIGRKKYGQKAMTAKSVAGRADESYEELDEQLFPEADYSAKKARAGKDIGKPGKAFSKIAKSAGERYGSKAAGERVAGAVLNKLRHPKESACMADEGNAFTGALAKTPKGGKFNVGGKEFTDTSSIEEEGTAPMTAKQKSFAKLAPPKDKITFADKIAGAKKEVDEMLGDVAAEAMRKAVMGNHEEEMDEGYAEMDAWLKKREAEKGTGKFDKRKTSTGTVYTRKPETFAGDDEEETSNKPKVKGRPKGTKRAIGAKGPTRKSKLAYGDMEEDLDTDGVMMATPSNMSSESAGDNKDVCPHCGHSLVDEKAPPGAKAERMVKHIKKSLSKDGKLSDKDKAIAYATTWKAHKAGKVEEESTEQEDQKAEKAGKKVAKDIEHDEGHKGKDDRKAEKAGKKVTKDIEYDDKKDKEEKVDETTVSGSVATAPAGGKSSKGMQFGKGVYESLDKQYKQALTESIQVQETVAECGDVMPGLAPEKGLTIQASGEDAIKLMQLLKLAGLAGGDACPSCGHSPCDCDAEMVDENSPDWPTNTEKIDADPNLRTYSSGLNGPKSTGQTTTPVIASQLRRQASMEESVKLEKTLSDLYKNYKG